MYPQDVQLCSWPVLEHMANSADTSSWQVSWLSLSKAMSSAFARSSPVALGLK
jgi:hypothetical protein